MPESKVFTQDIQQEISSLLRKTIQTNASESMYWGFSIHIAVAWFTDRHLFNTLKEVLESNKGNGACVHLVLWDDEINRQSGLPWQDLIDMGLHLMLLPNMHHKFCCIKYGEDSDIPDEYLAIPPEYCSITGSYNWTNNARLNNYENIIVSNDKQIYQDFRNAFVRIEMKWLNRFSCLNQLALYMKVVELIDFYPNASSSLKLESNSWKEITSILKQIKEIDNSVEIDEIILFSQTESKLLSIKKIKELLERHKLSISCYEKYVSSWNPDILVSREHNFIDFSGGDTTTAYVKSTEILVTDVAKVFKLRRNFDDVINSYPSVLIKQHLLEAVHHVLHWESL